MSRLDKYLGEAATKDWIGKIRSDFAEFDTSLSTSDFYSNGYKKEYKEIDKHLDKVNNILTSILKSERGK